MRYRLSKPRQRAIGAARHCQAVSPSGGQDFQHVMHRIGRLGTLIADATGLRIGGEQSACEDPPLFRQPRGLEQPMDAWGGEAHCCFI